MSLKYQRDYEQLLDPAFKNFYTVSERHKNCQDITQQIVDIVMIHDKKPYLLEMTFTSNFPFSPPDIKFISQIDHPDVDQNGRISYIGKYMTNWTPSLGCRGLLMMIWDFIKSTSSPTSPTSPNS